MITRQAKPIWAMGLLQIGLAACSAIAAPTPTATVPLPTSTSSSTPVPPTITPTATVTPPACLSQPGRVQAGSIDISNPAQEYLVYLPPCYDVRTDLRYPVLYLLHGQTYTDDQWVRLGAVAIADNLILTGQAPAFIIVFPDDRYWNLPAGPGFGSRLIEQVIPHIDETFRTLDDREQRALGGMSRGGGWTLRLGLTRWDLFGSLGLHSPAIPVRDAPFLDEWIAAIPPESFPRLWLDIGDRDKELGAARLLEETLSEHSVLHEWHQYSGDHSEVYWGQHVEEYFRWYVQGWMPADPGTPQP
jgi:enterochelin esterase-like enzyme